MLILISDAFDPSLPKVLSKHGEVTDDKGRVPEADIVLVRSKTKVTKEYMQGARNLKMVIRGGVGLDNIDLPYAAENGIVVRNTADASTTAVAELAFALMIALANNVVTATTTTRENKWLKKEVKRVELFGKTLGILGLGRIGIALATRASVFKMKVLGWHPDVNFTDFAEIHHNMEEVLEQSDFVSLHMPLLDDTRGLINKKTLAHFKDGAFLVNTARGKLIVEADVAEALKSGKLRGYAADVFMADPPPPDSPILSAPNTILTPHVGAETKENLLRIGVVAERIISEFVGKK
ncbi:MAG: hydroxyacid dehydrogenase [candidate division Zixibacteria bacterium RBG_16_53_22]|nr:MAG: hydroxyacid dehydrogenase [candidate division Zixibacteria bacterium RBG_16_53_22]